MSHLGENNSPPARPSSPANSAMPLNSSLRKERFQFSAPDINAESAEGSSSGSASMSRPPTRERQVKFRDVAAEEIELGGEALTAEKDEARQARAREYRTMQSVELESHLKSYANYLQDRYGSLPPDVFPTDQAPLPPGTASMTRIDPPVNITTVYETVMQEDEFDEPIGRFELVDVILHQVISHPFIVARRQCQINPALRTFHRGPIALLPVLYRMHARQGPLCLWKGLGSSVLVEGIHVVARSLVCELTGFPRSSDIQPESSRRRKIQNLALEFLSALITAPFFAVSVFESVQSCTVAEPYDLFGFFSQAAARCFILTYAANLASFSSRDLLPIYAIAVPYALYRTLHHVLAQVVQVRFYKYYVRFTHLKDDPFGDQSSAPQKQSRLLKVYKSFKARAFALLAADVLLYPLETIVNRLMTQGSRVLIDNMDDGVDVVPLSSGYTGVFQCFRSIVSDEGYTGLLKGFGGLAMQIAFHVALFKVADYMLTQTNVLQSLDAVNSSSQSEE